MRSAQEESMGSKIIKWLALLVFLPAICLADVINIKQSAPQVYVVQKGDTLWDISNMYLDKPWLWPELWRNNVHIVNPHLIYPGDELRLRYNEQGEAVLEMVRDTSKPTIKLSPEGRKTIKEKQPIDVLPWSVIQPYIENDSLMSQQDYDRLPHLLGNHEGAVRFSNGDLVLSRKARGNNDDYRIIRQQNEIRDEFDNLLGIQIRHVADAHSLPSDVDGQVLVKIEQANFEVKRGDKLMPEEEVDMDALVLEPADIQKGKVVSSLQQHQLLGKYDVVIVNLGSNKVSPGMVMGLYQQGPAIFDGDQPKYENESNIIKSAFDQGTEVNQPAIKVGEAVVFKTFDKASYALITRASKVIRNGALVAKP